MTISEQYQRGEREEVIPWDTDPHDSGFSILRQYPTDCGFIPVRRPDGSDDTVALIKVGYGRNKIKDGKAQLYVNVSKFERYLSGRARYDFADSNSPKKEAIDASNKSLQPIELLDASRYIYDVNQHTVHDVETNKTVSVNDVVDNIFKQHLKTIKGIKAVIFKGKLGFQGTICYKVVPTCETALKRCNMFLFGKGIRQNDHEWLEGYYKPIPHVRLTTVYPHTVPFFQTDLKISKAAIFWIAVTVLILHFVLPRHLQLDAVSGVAMIVILIFVFDSWAPHLVLGIINALIRFRVWLGEKRIEIK
jgi:hypothetical protein